MNATHWYKLYFLGSSGRPRYEILEAASAREARQIAEAVHPREVVIAVYRVNEVGAIIG